MSFIFTIQVQVQSPKSKVQSQKDLEWLYSAVPPTTTHHTNFSQQPNIQKKIKNSILDCGIVESNSSLSIYLHWVNK